MSSSCHPTLPLHRYETHRSSLGSFLNEIERIATRDYEPSDNDVIRARLRTLGVQEYSFWVEEGMAGLTRPMTD